MTGRGFSKIDTRCSVPDDDDPPDVQEHSTVEGGVYMLSFDTDRMACPPSGSYRHEAEDGSTTDGVPCYNTVVHRGVRTRWGLPCPE